MNYFLSVCFFMSITSVLAGITSEQAFKRLQEGNIRFVKEKMEHPERTQERREVTFSKQEPYAIILGCSDSRVPPEIIFDEGIGNLFVIRVAGNVLGPSELDSLEFSVIVNKSVFVLVLGHENCGAVQAVLAKDTKNIPNVAALIEPNLKKIDLKDPKFFEKGIIANVQGVVDQLKKIPFIAERIEKKQLEVVGGYYHLSSGKVDFLK